MLASPCWAQLGAQKRKLMSHMQTDTIGAVPTAAVVLSSAFASPSFLNQDIS